MNRQDERRDMSEPEKLPAGQTFVDGIEVFTKLLDGGGPVRCECGHLFRVPNLLGGGHEACPACGRDSLLHATRATGEEYKASRADDAEAP